jgi:4-amino-4-deoxy-L-arabinose transferase-like glycosyltransferase
MNGGKKPSRLEALSAGVVIGAVFATLTFKTWRRWPDMVVDFGAQLYMPWQISTGAVLYRDVHYLAGGPLSQYYHALLFRIFGVSFQTLFVSNLVVLTLLLTVIYFCFRRSSDRLTAITACVAVLLVFAFGHYTTVGIFNYLTPYSAEVVHGLVLSVLAVALLARWIETKNEWWAGAAGLCVGLTLLTKPDMFLALMPTLACGTALFWRTRRQGEKLSRSLALMASGALLPGIGCFFLFLSVEDFEQSARSVFAAWIPLLTTSAAQNPFYRWCMGLDQPWLHLRQTFSQYLGLAGVTALCAVAGWQRFPARLAYLAAALLAICLIQASWGFHWFNCGYCLPLVCMTLLAMLVWRGTKEGWEPPLVFATLWAVWSLALLVKLGLFCRIWHYGFALAMPAFVSGIYLLLWVLPQQLQRRGIRPLIFRGLLWLMLLPGLTRLTLSSLKIYSEKTVSISSGADTMLAFSPHYRPSDAQIAATLGWVATNLAPSATLAVLPQGAMLNYLSRHPNPCGYVAWNPPEMAAFGQEQMTGAFIAHSPDYVIELFVDYSEYGETNFGREKRFGREVQEWIDAHYQLVQTIGHDWLKDGQFGIKILKKTGS